MTVDPLSSNSILDGLGGTATTSVPTSDPNQALSQEDFFALLTQQLSYQDPTKPVENDQMISQMTNFTMADGISGLNSNFADFAASMTSNQALQASSLVGQQVLVPGDKAVLQGVEGERSSAGAFSLPQSVQNVQVRIEDDAGQLIRTRVDNIRIAGRATSGVWVLRTKDEERVVSVARLADSGEDDTEES